MGHLRHARHSALIGVVLSSAAAATAAAQAPLTPSSFSTHAEFSIDKFPSSFITAVATLEPLNIAPGYSRIWITFFPFPMTPDDVAAASKGSIATLEARRAKMSTRPEVYNRNYAALVLTFDKDHKLSNVNMAVPGHTCTIAWKPAEIERFAPGMQFDANRLKLASKGSYACDMVSIGAGIQVFHWNVDLDIPVFPKGQP
jgi:hypothetical protein